MTLELCEPQLSYRLGAPLCRGGNNHSWGSCVTSKIRRGRLRFSPRWMGILTRTRQWLIKALIVYIDGCYPIDWLIIYISLYPLWCCQEYHLFNGLYGRFEPTVSTTYPWSGKSYQPGFCISDGCLFFHFRIPPKTGFQKGEMHPQDGYRPASSRETIQEVVCFNWDFSFDASLLWLGPFSTWHDENMGMGQKPQKTSQLSGDEHRVSTMALYQRYPLVNVYKKRWKDPPCY